MLRIISQQLERNYITADDVKAEISKTGYGGFKYVKMQTGEYRFCDIQSFSCDHKSISNGEPVSSAGFMKLNEEGLTISGYSMSLNIGPDAMDYDDLPKLFGVPYKDKY